MAVISAFRPRGRMAADGRCASEDRRLCGLCDASLGEEAVLALSRLWHPDHFLCNACRKPIRQTFQVSAGKAYCVQCFAHTFNPKCAGEWSGVRGWPPDLPFGLVVHDVMVCSHKHVSSPGLEL